jgi:hypothetical protein
MTVAPALRPGLHEQRADGPGARGHEHHISVAWGREVEDRDGGGSGADHGHGCVRVERWWDRLQGRRGGTGQLGVAA